MFLTYGNESLQSSDMREFVAYNHVDPRLVAARSCRLQTPWSECSQECGSIGSRSRDTTCSLNTFDGRTLERSTSLVYEECFVACPTDESIAVDTTTVTTIADTTEAFDTGTDAHVETTTRMSIMYYLV